MDKVFFSSLCSFCWRYFANNVTFMVLMSTHPFFHPCQMAGMLSVIMLYICRQLIWRQEWFRPDQVNNGNMGITRSLPVPLSYFATHTRHFSSAAYPTWTAEEEPKYNYQWKVQASHWFWAQIYVFAVFWIGANCLLHLVLLCTCQKSVVICMYFYLKLNRWNRKKIISSFSQWSAKSWLMLLTRVLTIREQLPCALLIYFCTYKIHFTVYLYSLSLHRNVWHTCHLHTCSMTKPPEENVVWGSSSMISLKLRGALKRKTYYCAFAKPFSACLLGSLGKRQFGSCRSQQKIVETGFCRIFSSFTGLAFLWILFRLNMVVQKIL